MVPEKCHVGMESSQKGRENIIRKVAIASRNAGFWRIARDKFLSRGQS